MNGQRRNLIIFTEHRATLEYLKNKLGELLNDPHAIVTIHGGIPFDERRRVQDIFHRDDGVLVLVATDAAGEGVNLQCAHLMVNYDLPWNPNRIEQRFGRIHRIGQTEVCHLWNVVTSETREGAVYLRLLQKLERISVDLGGKVFDVLGELFEGTPLQNLLREAIRYGDDQARLDRLGQTVEDAVDILRIQALADRVLAKDVIDLDRLREGLQAEDAERLHGSDLQRFLFGVLDLFPPSVRQMNRLPCGCYDFARIPGVIVEQARRSGRKGIKTAYPHISFDQDPALRASRNCATEFIEPDHPLLEAVLDWTRERWLGASPTVARRCQCFWIRGRTANPGVFSTISSGQ